MQAAVRDWRRTGASVGLVPTMGAIHAGHLSLMTRALRENERMVVSIFVNPLQFGPDEDFGWYPRPFEADLSKVNELGIDTVFAPSLEEMYPAGATTRVKVGGLNDVLEGAFRPGHFEGVATVVSKLFNACVPDRAYFGQKDAQQVAVVRHMVKDLNLGLEIRVCPIVREPDGLALSSRNAFLSTDERLAARSLSSSLRAANDAYQRGERDPARLRNVMQATLAAEPLARPDYAECVDPEDFVSPGQLAVLAVKIGAIRLIDNHLLGEPFGPTPSG